MRADTTILVTSTLRFGKVLARPAEDVLVAAPVVGRVLTTYVAVGAHVAAGDLLVTFEPPVDPARTKTHISRAPSSRLHRHRHRAEEARR